MFGINYLKTSPTQYVLHFQDGRLRRAGAGLAFLFYKPASSIVVVPVGSADVPFIFNEMSADFQPLTVQGQLTYRIQDPQRVAGLLDFSIDPATGRHVSEDPQKLNQRLVNLIQVLVRDELMHLSMRQAIQASQAIAASAQERLREGSEFAELGVEVLSLALQAIKPSPEMTRALEAEAREDLLRRADLAIYERRNAAVEQERRIKENELSTEIAVEEKKRQIRETKVEADLAVEAREQQVRERRLAGEIKLEEERKRLVTARGENAHAEADVQAYAVDASLRPLRDLDPALAQMLAVQSADPRRMVSMALKEMAQNASKIGNLNLSPDLLESLMREA
jgi:regulator of protease activity HflC (stomatin/prohibitin superfamily)